jgi:hypothetical protein
MSAHPVDVEVNTPIVKYSDPEEISADWGEENVLEIIVAELGPQKMSNLSYEEVNVDPPTVTWILNPRLTTVYSRPTMT